MKLINISNHNSKNWSKEQNIPANATTKELIDKAYWTVNYYIQWRVI